MDEECWTKIRKEQSRKKELEVQSPEISVTGSAMADSATTSIKCESQLDGRNGIIVDSDRELRIKLYMGQVCTVYVTVLCSTTYARHLAGDYGLDVVHPVIPYGS